MWLYFWGLGPTSCVFSEYRTAALHQRLGIFQRERGLLGSQFWKVKQVAPASAWVWFRQKVYASRRGQDGQEGRSYWRKPREPPGTVWWELTRGPGRMPSKGCTAADLGPTFENGVPWAPVLRTPFPACEPLKEHLSTPATGSPTGSATAPTHAPVSRSHLTLRERERRRVGDRADRRGKQNRKREQRWL